MAKSLRQILRALGLRRDLVLCLDALDPASNNGGPLWKDVSGNGNHFIRGQS
jgi:hypothetical protein